RDERLRTPAGAGRAAPVWAGLSTPPGRLAGDRVERPERRRGVPDAPRARSAEVAAVGEALRPAFAGPAARLDAHAVAVAEHAAVAAERRAGRATDVLAVRARRTPAAAPGVRGDPAVDRDGLRDVPVAGHRIRRPVRPLACSRAVPLPPIPER